MLLMCFTNYFQAQTLRKKISRVEDDNDSLAMQLKKMATKARSMLSTDKCFQRNLYDFG